MRAHVQNIWVKFVYEGHRVTDLDFTTLIYSEDVPGLCTENAMNILILYEACHEILQFGLWYMTVSDNEQPLNLATTVKIISNV